MFLSYKAPTNRLLNATDWIFTAAAKASKAKLWIPPVYCWWNCFKNWNSNKLSSVCCFFYKCLIKTPDPLKHLISDPSCPDLFYFNKLLEVNMICAATGSLKHQRLKITGPINALNQFIWAGDDRKRMASCIMSSHMTQHVLRIWNNIKRNSCSSHILNNRLFRTYCTCTSQAYTYRNSNKSLMMKPRATPVLHHHHCSVSSYPDTQLSVTGTMKTKVFLLESTT